MELNEILESRRSCRAFLSKPVSREIITELISASTKAPVSCNLQISKYIIIDDLELLRILAQKISSKFSYSPCAIIVLTDAHYTIERSSGIFSTAMAVENMVLKAVDLGLATCPIAGFADDDILKDLLKIPSNFEINLILSVGYQDFSVLQKPIHKIETNKIFSFNQFGESSSIRDYKNLEKSTIKSIVDYRQRIAPVYLDRFRLNTYSDLYYQKVVEFFRDNFLQKDSLKILDIFSYDGKFLQLLFSKNFINKKQVVSSDYLEDNLSFFKEKFDCQTAVIDDQNQIKIDSTGHFDLATLIFQLEFTPQLELIIPELNRLLKNDGFVFVVSMKESVSRRFIKFLVRLYKKFIKQKKFNIYENNQFYKIGYQKIYSKREVIKIFAKESFSLDRSGVLFTDTKTKAKIFFYIFKKTKPYKK